MIQLDENKKTYPDAQTVRAGLNLLLRWCESFPYFGKPRPVAASEVATTWREVKIGKQTFRVLTLEDPS